LASGRARDKGHAGESGIVSGSSQEQLVGRRGLSQGTRAEIKAVRAMPEGRTSRGDVALWCSAGVMALVLFLLAPHMSSTMLSHKSILTHGITATSAWFLTSSGRSVAG